MTSLAFLVVEPLKHRNMSFLAPFVVFHPTPAGHVEAMTRRGGNPLGLVGSGPLTTMQTSWMWKDKEDDEVNIEANRVPFVRIEREAGELGVLKSYVYHNYAWEDQDVFGGYGRGNLEKLKRIQKGVHPEGVFANGGLCGGYFKINARDEKEQGQKVRDEL
jgi:hypothetical protein